MALVGLVGAALELVLAHILHRLYILLILLMAAFLLRTAGAAAVNLMASLRWCLLLSSTCSAAQEGLVQLSVQVLRCLALELLGLAKLGRVQPSRKASCVLGGTHHVGIDGCLVRILGLSLDLAGTYVVHLRNAIVVVMMTFLLRQRSSSALSSATVIGLSLTLLLRSLCRHIIQ